MIHKKYRAVAGSALFSIISAVMVLAWYYTVVCMPVGIRPAGEDVPYKTISFKVEDGLKYHHITGSNIEIPAAALTDAHGNVITGEATILYREFHTAEDMMKADIPMGDIEEEALQSAGMFEIKALQNDEELHLAEGKNINVQLAAYRPSPGYDVFRLNENYTWDLNAKPQLVVNNSKFDSCAKLPPIPDEPVNPEATAKDIVVDIDANYTEHTYLKPFEKTRWKVVKTAGTDVGGKDEWVFRVQWDKLNVRKDAATGNYYLDMTSSNRTEGKKTVTRSFRLPVIPLLTGKALEEALAEYEKQYAEYEKLQQMMAAEEQRLALEADALNTFNIDKMGIWNVDKYVNKDLFVKIDAGFEYSVPVNAFFNKIRIYVMNHDDNTVQEYNPYHKNALYLKEGSNTSIMAMLPNNKIAIYTAGDFKKVNFSNYSSRGESYTFHLKVYDADMVMHSGLAMR
jgi:hypothetical protein